MLRPALFAIDAERAHGMTIAMLAAWGTRGGGRGGRPVTDPVLRSTVAGLDFANPVGLAAGVDKDGRAIDGFFALGFGGVGDRHAHAAGAAGQSQTPHLPASADRAVINRLGFNNGGIDAALPRARAAKRSGILGINVGANKEATDRVADYVAGVHKATDIADYVTINISSPNTPGLRDLQHGAALAELLAAANEARSAGTRRPPLFLKVAPDLNAQEIDGIARAAIDHHVDALIVSNTTLSRPPLTSRNAKETGGLSGAPLAALARQRLADFRTATGATLPLVSVGGIDSADEAYARIRLGASLVQLYSALVFEGPGLPRRIARGLAVLLQRDGYATVADAVGAAV